MDPLAVAEVLHTVQGAKPHKSVSVLCALPPSFDECLQILCKYIH